MKTEEVHTLFERLRKDTRTIYDSMHWKDVPNYGNVVITMNQVLTLGNDVLPLLSGLQSWVDSYNINHLWIERLFKQGCKSVKEYKTWGAYFLPKPPSLEEMKDWSHVETLYKGSFDIQYIHAVQAAYNVAVKSRTVPYKHTDECLGGLICIRCEDLEWKWHKECLEEADMPNNPFWNETLQTQFLEELRTIAVAPEGWVYQVSSTNTKPREYKESSTPFQRAVEVSFYVSDWSCYYSKYTTDYDLFVWLSENLPTLEQRIRSDMDRADDILAMF
jgi:hypothetical protein